jgi:hypothetical protein
MDDDALYGVDREQFIGERNAWVKSLRADGRGEEAARVAALRKPSVAAAVVNRLVRAEPDRLAALVDGGDALRAAQDRMLSGDGTAEEVRAALERERAAVDVLLSVAAEQGMSGAVSDRVAATLHAAALDADAREQVRGGRLVEELQHVGFGGEPSAARPAPSSSRSPAKVKRAEERERAEQQRLTEERTHARHVERDARRRRETAERALANAEQRHATARAAFQEAEDNLTTAQAEAQAASEAHDAAQRALDALPA